MPRFLSNRLRVLRRRTAFGLGHRSAPEL